MPVLGVRDLERELSGRKSGRERDSSRGAERESRGRRGRRYRSRSYDSRPRSQSGPRRSGSVGSTMSMGSRRGGSRGGQMHGGNFPHQNLPSLKNLRKQLRMRYNDKAMQLVTRYIEDMELSAEVINNINYLRRCRDLIIIPKEYWMINSSIRNTREVVRMLDECSFRLMCHDQQYYMLRRVQLSKQLSRTEQQLDKALSVQDLQRLLAVAKAHRSDLFSRIRDGQRKAVDELRKEIENYESFLKEKRKPRRSGDGVTDGRRRVRNKNKENRNRSSKVDENNNKIDTESKGSDEDDDRSEHHVERRQSGRSVSSNEDDSAGEQQN